MNGRHSVRSGIHSPRGLSSPRRQFPGQERREPQIEKVLQRVKVQDDAVAEMQKRMDAMKLTMMDFQVILTSHEKEVEGLWARGVPATPMINDAHELLELKRQVALLTERVEVAECRNLKPVPESLQASTMELLFNQNREFMDELDLKLKVTQDASLRESDRVESQLAAIREALQLGDKQQDIDLRASESKITRNLHSIQNETHALWSCLASSLASPNVPIDSLGDGSIVSKVGGVRDAIFNVITAQLSQAVETMRREADDRSKYHDSSLKKMQMIVDRNGTLVENVATEMKEAPASLMVQNDTMGMIDAVKRHVEHQMSDLTTKITSQQLGVVDIDRRLTDKIQGLGDAFSQMEAVVGKLNDDARLEQNSIQDIMSQIAGVREEQVRSSDDARNSSLAFQEQCNDVLQRHIAEVRERLVQQQQDTKAQLHIAGEKALAANRLSEAVRAQMDDLSSAQKRVQSEMHELELHRKEDLRRIQQHTTDAVTRVQQLTSADLHRLQKETTQELQRYEDAASSLYRTVEELRGVQQRTLEEYHRQGDEQAMVHAKFQQQLTEVNSVLKEQLQSESDRLQGQLRTESQTLNDQMVRMKTDMGERVGATERRLGETESAIDSFRGRLRSLEMNDTGKLDKAFEELKQRTAHIDAKVHTLDNWRSEAISKIGSLEGRIADAGNAAQLTVMGRKLDEVERGLNLARGSEKEELRRAIKSDVEKSNTLLEGRVDKRVDSLAMQVQDHDNIINQVRRDISDNQALIGRNTESIARVDTNTQALMKKLRDNITKELQPMIEGCNKQIKTTAGVVSDLQTTVDELEELIKTREAETEKATAQFDELKDDMRKQLMDYVSKMSEMEKLFQAIRNEFDIHKSDLNSNTAEDEKRARELQQMLYRECDNMKKTFEDMFDKMRADLASNSEEDERRAMEMQRIVTTYSDEFKQMRTDLEKNQDDDLKREQYFQQMVDELVADVEQKNKQSVKEMEQIHMAANDLFQEMQQQFGVWRDRVAQSEQTLQKLDGMLHQSINENRNTLNGYGEKIDKLEIDLQTQVRRANRELERLGSGD